MREWAQTGSLPTRAPPVPLTKSEAASYRDLERAELAELNRRYLESMLQGVEKERREKARRLRSRKTKRLIVGFDEETYGFLKAQAETQRTTMSRLVRSAICFARVLIEANPFQNSQTSIRKPIPLRAVAGDSFLTT